MSKNTNPWIVTDGDLFWAGPAMTNLNQFGTEHRPTNKEIKAAYVAYFGLKAFPRALKAVQLTDEQMTEMGLTTEDPSITFDASTPAGTVRYRSRENSGHIGDHHTPARFLATVAALGHPYGFPFAVAANAFTFGHRATGGDGNRAAIVGKKEGLSTGHVLLECGMRILGEQVYITDDGVVQLRKAFADLTVEGKPLCPYWPTANIIEDLMATGNWAGTGYILGEWEARYTEMDALGKQLDDYAEALNKEPVARTEVAVYEEPVEDVDGEIVDEASIDAIMADIRNALAAFDDARYRTVVAAWTAGAALHRAKALEGQYGDWKEWLDTNFGLSQRTATDYMNVASFVKKPAELEQYTSINAVLKAIREGKKGGLEGTPERDLQARLAGISKASKKLAEVIEMFATDLKDETPEALENWESLTNRAVLPLVLALGDLDKLWGV